MKFTLAWLQDYLDTEASLDEICASLTAIGLEVEDVHDRAVELAPFIVAHVLECGPHPDADKLQVCKVDTGAGTFQVVCGAPNAHAGMKGVFAPPGSVIPANGMKLKPAKIRGVESNGMLCSEREMGLSDDHEGIIELAEDAPVGERFAALWGLDDPVIEIAITPNHQDALGVYGIARDLAVAGLGRLKAPYFAKIEGSYDAPMTWQRDLPAAAGAACPMVAGRHFRGVTNGASPKWMQDRLLAIGLRPISALVDITNYVTFDLGRPLHVYDCAKVTGDLTMRLSKDGETCQLLDGRDYTLPADLVVIADEVALHGVGGVMGGEASGVSAGTTEVFLEVALFDPIRIAEAGRKLGVDSDARYRFERGVDPQSVHWGVEVATRLILEICGGETSQPVHAGDEPAWQQTYPLRLARIAALGGVEVPQGEPERILTELGFDLVAQPGQTDIYDVTPPSWRMDVIGEADLVEEVLRIRGYDSVPAVPLPRLAPVSRPALNLRQARRADIRRALAARGMTEAVTNSFCERRVAELFGGVSEALVLLNPISSDLDVMRPSVLPHLIAAAGRNADKGLGASRLFEVGPAYRDPTPGGQDTVAAGLRNGQHGARHWAQPQRPVDAFDAKADALAALVALGAPVDKLQVVREAPDWYHPGRSAALKLGPRVTLGWFGELHPRVLRALDVGGPVVGFEVFLDALPAPKSKSTTRPKLDASAFQPVRRDFAFVVDADAEAETLLRAARGADPLIAEVSLFDVYTGEHVGAGRKSLAIEAVLQPTERTLTDEEIEAVAAKLVAAVTKATGGSLRG